MPVVPVLDSTMFYREVGTGTPMIFLHGNPTSSYLWRHILDGVGDPGRRLAPDLIGMGDSGKPDIGYTFADHAIYLEAWFDALEIDDAVIIGHDWGGALGFDWAARHSQRVRALIFSETIVKPLTWNEFPEAGRALFGSIRTPRIGEKMVLEDNAFIEQLLPGSVVTPIHEDDLREYRRPYPTAESRKPLLQWPRSLPLDGEPADVVARIETYDQWLGVSHDVPKLLLSFEPGPGVMMGPEIIEWCKQNFANLEIRRLGPAGHHTPEDQPHAIAATLANWLDTNNLRAP